jgi:DNA-binding IclR family transcriptional regulator
MERRSDIRNSTITGEAVPDDENDIAYALNVRDNSTLGGRRSTAAPRSPDTAVGVLDRSVAILEAVERGNRSFRAIVESTGLPKPTAHRLIASLEQHGFLFHVGGLGYALGPRLLQLATTAMRELPLRQLARPVLERLARTTGESTQLYVRQGHTRICVDSVESANELRTIVPVGAELPLDKGSAGKVFLTWGPTPEGLDMSDIDTALATTRRRGWADSYGEREKGVASVSAPVFGPLGELLAAVSISGPQMRLAGQGGKRYGPAVAEAAREIEALLGRT